MRRSDRAAACRESAPISYFSYTTFFTEPQQDLNPMRLFGYASKTGLCSCLDRLKRHSEERTA